MSDKADFKARQKEVEKISKQEVILPNMPVKVYINEAEHLYRSATRDRKELEAASLDTVTIEELKVRTGVCRVAQSLLVSERNLKEDAQKEWDEKSPIAYELKGQLTHDCDFAFRKEPALLKRLNEIREGDGHADMIQDLSDLSVLCEKNWSYLEAINVPRKRVQQAGDMADEMGGLLAMANREDGADAIAKEFRDKAYTYLKVVVDEVRDFGKYVFWKDKEKLKDYSSQYRRDQNSK